MVLVLLVVVLIFVIAAVIAITQGVRKITVQYAKRVVGRKMYGGQTQYMPLKVIMRRDADHLCVGAALVPSDDRELRLQEQSHCESHCCSAFDRVAALSRSCGNDFLLQLLLGRHAISTDPNRGRPEEIRGYIPGVRPGKPTADFLDYTMTRLTFAGAIFLTLIAVFPSLLSQWLNVPVITAQFFGGTSLLIIVASCSIPCGKWRRT
jgi:Preprotein translocase subunit SecY